MPSIRVASINGEWMNSWFTADGQPVAFVNTFKLPGESASNSSSKTATKLAALITAINPDILAMQEAPSRKEELDLFVSQYLSDPSGPRYATILGDSGGAQKLALLYKPAKITASLAPSTTLTTLLDPWQADVDGSMMLGPYQFTRTPLVVDVTVAGHDLQAIVMHTKSSFVNNGESMWTNPTTRQTYVVTALKARRRNSSEGMRTRRYLNERLAADPSQRMIVMGDLNDGPGMDYFEENYLAHNVTDILLGSGFDPEGMLTHAQHDVGPADRYTAVFDDFVENVSNKKLLLDHLLLSPGLIGSAGLRKKKGSGTIHHTEFNAQWKNNGKKREDRATDHRPVSVVLQY